MHHHTVKKNPNGSYTLVRDGNDCRCPKSMVVVPVQLAMGQQALQPTQMGCSTLCPFASIAASKLFKDVEGTDGRQEAGEGLIYIIECEGQKKTIELQEPAEEKKQSPLIKM